MNRPSTFPTVLAAALLASACQGAVTAVGSGPAGAPTLELSSRSLSFAVAQPGEDPPPQRVVVDVRPARDVAPPVASVAYLEGTGWLLAGVEGGTAPFALRVEAVTAGLASGTYRATVTVASPRAANSPQALLVELTVGGSTPASLAVTPPALAFEGEAGSGGPAPQVLSVTSSSGGRLALPTATVGYASGADWLSALVSGTTAPFAVTVAATPAGLAPGRYEATVFVASSGAAGSPAAVPVTLAVNPPAPVISVAPVALSFVATRGGADPAPQEVTVGSASAGALAPPTATASAGWLSVTVAGGPAAFTLRVAPAVAGLAAGAYAGAVAVASPGAANSPVTVPVALAVTPGPAAGTLAPASLPLQSAQAGHPVADPPAVLVLDASARPVAGVPVQFEVVSGGGALSGADATSGEDGVARVASWTLGTAGGQQVLALAPGYAGSPVTFDATLRAGSFDLTLRFLGPWSSSQRVAVQRARERVEQLVVGDLPDFRVDRSAAELAGCGGQPVAETVDDVLVFVAAEPVDGPGQALGSAGPCLVREGSRLPILGLLRIDLDDRPLLEATGQLEAVVLHELLHVLGFGTLWGSQGWLVDAGGPDPHFAGPQTLDAFVTWNGGALYPGTRVPVENAGGVGNRDAHWRESVFRNELMTGWISGASQPLSRTTAASLADLGFAVDAAAADPFHLATASLVDGGGTPSLELRDDVLRFPVEEVGGSVGGGPRAGGRLVPSPRGPPR